MNIGFDYRSIVNKNDIQYRSIQQQLVFLDQKRVAAILDQICNDSGDYIEISDFRQSAMAFPQSKYDNVELFARFLQQKHNIIHLRLCNIEFSFTSAAAMGVAISKSNLKSLDLRRLTFTEHTSIPPQRIAMYICDGIRNNKTIESYHVDQMGPQYQRLFYDDVIGSMEALRSVSYRYAFDENSSFFGAVERLQQVEYVDFSNAMDLNDDQVLTALLDHLPYRKLQKVCLSDNNIGVDSATSVLRRMFNHQTWCIVDLSRNSKIGYNGLKVLGEMLHNFNVGVTPPPKYISLVLDGTAGFVNFTEEEDPDGQLMRNQHHLRDLAQLSLLNAVKANHSVVYLFDYQQQSYITPAIYDTIQFHLFMNRNGRHLLATQPDGLSPYMLSFLISVMDRRQSEVYYTNAIFYLLRESPHLFTPPRTDCRKRKAVVNA